MKSLELMVSVYLSFWFPSFHMGQKTPLPTLRPFVCHSLLGHVGKAENDGDKFAPFRFIALILPVLPLPVSLVSAPPVLC